MAIREQNCQLQCVCGNVKQFPAETLPEIAFAGKSNVGKSSLINMLLGRKGLARTSSVPGKTQTVNWYNIDRQLYFVDLPGYGYAKAGKAEQARWSKVIEQYLHKRKTLRGVILLVDIRREISENDRMMMDWLGFYKIPAILVATKADKLSRAQAAAAVKAIAEDLGIDKSLVIPASIMTKAGRDEIWQSVTELLGKGETEDGSSAVGE